MFETLLLIHDICGAGPLMAGAGSDIYMGLDFSNNQQLLDHLDPLDAAAVNGVLLSIFSLYRVCLSVCLPNMDNPT